jgi:ketosteroid isomerase-like protein
MTLEDNKALVRRQFDAIQAQDWDAFDALHTPDIANHALGRVQTGVEPFKAILRAIH